VFSKRTRLSAFDYLGFNCYFLTCCTAARAPLFTTATAVELVLTQTVKAAEIHGFEIIAYCFMPDHLHALVAGLQQAADLRQFVKDAKQYSGFHYKREFGRALWRPSYFERVLRAEEDRWGVARYIVENPLRAGLATRADEYPFLGSCVVEKENLLAFVASAKPWSRR
jgi:putative transposase